MNTDDATIVENEEPTTDLTAEDLDRVEALYAEAKPGPQWVGPVLNDPLDRWEIGEQLEDDPPHITVHDFGGEALAKLVAELLTIVPWLLRLARLGLLRKQEVCKTCDHWEGIEAPPERRCNAVEGLNAPKTELSYCSCWRKDRVKPCPT